MIMTKKMKNTNFLLFLVYIDVQGRSSTSLHVLTSPIYPKPVGHITDPDTGDVHM